MPKRGMRNLRRTKLQLPHARECMRIPLTVRRQALRDARARGVRVRVLSDDEQAREIKSAVPQLIADGVPVRTDRSVKYHLHHKFCLVDGGPLLVHGCSFN